MMFRGRRLRAVAVAMAAAMLIGAKQPKVGEMAPDAEITLVDGTKFHLSDLRGQVVVLNFWATWCAPCREELPILDGYYGLRKDAGLRVFAVTTEDSVPIRQLKKLFALMKIPAARKITGAYGDIRAVPTNYIIDRSGHIRYAKAAAFELDDLNRELVPLLREPPPAD